MVPCSRICMPLWQSILIEGPVRESRIIFQAFAPFAAASFHICPSRVSAWRSLSLMAEGFIYRRLTYIKVAKVDGLFSPSYTRRLLPPSVLPSFQQQAMLLPIMEGKKRFQRIKKLVLQDSKSLRSGHLIAVINGCLQARRELHIPFEAGGSDLGRLG